MSDWIRIEPVKINGVRENLPEPARGPGVLLHSTEGYVRLIGHLNEDQGTCGCCSDQFTVDAYRVLDIDWTDQPEPIEEP